jgi:6-phosphogluconolactonase
MSTRSLGYQPYLIIGTYNSTNEKGIFIYRFNHSSGQAILVADVETHNPSYLAITRDGQFIYAANETKGNPEVSAFYFDRSNCGLTFINKQFSGGDSPCYVTVGANGKWLFVANYNGGNLSAFPINEDGSLNPYSQLIQHTGYSINTHRQTKPHVHSVMLTLDECFLCVTDLGIDKILFYKFNAASKQPLSKIARSFTDFLPGSGPRHVIFHQQLPFLYVIAELSGTISVFKCQNAHLNLIQIIEIPLTDQSDDRSSADIHISPDGNFLYASTRGQSNNISIYLINKDNGSLKFLGLESTRGLSPRNFVIDPTGGFLLVANVDSDNVAIFKRNQRTGLLQFTGKQISVPKPACLKITSM